MHDAKLYPVKSSNGSSIILYGHDEGLTVIWRGGRRLRASHNHYTRQKSSQQSRDQDVITFDSDSGAPHASQSSRAGPYEDDEEEQDPTKPFEPIVATHEIQLGCAVYSIAVAPLPANNTLRSAVPGVFDQRIVVAASCSNTTVQLVSLPLDPTTKRKSIAPNDQKVFLPRDPDDKDKSTSTNGDKKSTKDVHRIEVTSAQTHFTVPRGIALSYTNTSHDAPVGDEDTEMAEDGQTSKHASNAWQLLIASHSWSAGGLLAVSRLQFKTGHIDNSFEHASCSTDTIILSSMGTTLSFNPARYHSPRHSWLLLADASGALRLFETAAPRRSIDGRRLSSRDGGQLMHLRTQLLTTFYAPYAPKPAESFPTTRLKLLDVAWALNGRCFMTLLENGRWGIWDFTEAGPQTTEKHKSLGPQSIPGTGMTKFSLEGQLQMPSKDDFDGSTTDSGSINRATASAPSTLAPMTPKTRKTRQESLFASSTGGLKPVRLIKGNISVSSHISRDTHDESVVISYGQEFFALPKLMATWKQAQDAQKASGAVSGQAPVHAPNMQHITSLSTLGEMVTGIAQFPGDSSSHSTAFAHDVMAVAEHRLVIWCPTKLQHKPARRPENLFARPQPTEEEKAIQRVDQDRLKSGDLDLGGMDRMLASMSGGRRSLANEMQLGSPLAGKSRSKSGLFAS